MAQIIDIKRVEIGPKSLVARVRVAIGAPLMTSEDLEGTTRVYRLLPHIIDHVCLGDSSETFKDVMGDTELAHLLEHMTVELLAQTDIAGDITCGRTWLVEDERRTYDIEFPCPDDVLVVGALSSAAWMLQWAYSGGGEPEPNVEATVRGLVELIQSLPEPAPNPSREREYVVVEEVKPLSAMVDAQEDEAGEMDATVVGRPLTLSDEQIGEVDEPDDLEPAEQEGDEPTAETEAAPEADDLYDDPTTVSAPLPWDENPKDVDEPESDSWEDQ